MTTLLNFQDHTYDFQDDFKIGPADRCFIKPKIVQQLIRLKLYPKPNFKSLQDRIVSLKIHIFSKKLVYKKRVLGRSKIKKL